jgi:polyhydroxybutyrate depolymerase
MRTVPRWWIVAAVSLGGIPFIQAQRDSLTLGPGDHRLWLTVGALRREYLVHVPESYRARAPIPVVLMFHGSGGSIESDVKGTGWIKKGEQEGFVTVFPNGFPDENGMRVWNDGPPPRRGDADDVQFTRAMLDDLIRRLRVDRSRVYVVGFSNGAGLSFRLAAELNDRVAAVAPVAGRLWLTDMTLKRAVPTMFVVGTADGMMRPDSGFGTEPAVERPMLRRTLSRWAGLLGCQPEPRAMGHEGRIEAFTYDGCGDGSEFRLYLIDGWEHYWPGGINPGMEMWAENVIWEFFRKHPLR